MYPLNKLRGITAPSRSPVFLKRLSRSLGTPAVAAVRVADAVPVGAWAPAADVLVLLQPAKPGESAVEPRLLPLYVVVARNRFGRATRFKARLDVARALVEARDWPTMPLTKQRPPQAPGFSHGDKAADF